LSAADSNISWWMDKERLMMGESALRMSELWIAWLTVKMEWPSVAWLIGDFRPTVDTRCKDGVIAVSLVLVKRGVLDSWRSCPGRPWWVFVLRSNGRYCCFATTYSYKQDWHVRLPAVALRFRSI
jgi:hypothetical protein